MLVDVCDRYAVCNVPKPPSAIMKQLFSDKGGKIQESMIESVAKQVLLPCNECKI